MTERDFTTFPQQLALRAVQGVDVVSLELLVPWRRLTLFTVFIPHHPTLQTKYPQRASLSRDGVVGLGAVGTLDGHTATAEGWGDTGRVNSEEGPFEPPGRHVAQMPPLQMVSVWSAHSVCSEP